MNGRLKPLERGDLNLPALPEWTAKLQRENPGMTEEQARMHREHLLSHEIWINNEYQVNLDKTPDHGFAGAVLWHLSIKRRDKGVVHDWRDLQAIKNALVGPEFEAIELYPSSARVVDSANQYHLFAFIEVDGERAPRLPFGWQVRFVLGTSEHGAKQRGLHQEGATL